MPKKQLQSGTNWTPSAQTNGNSIWVARINISQPLKIERHPKSKKKVRVEVKLISSRKKLKRHLQKSVPTGSGKNARINWVPLAIVNHKCMLTLLLHWNYDMRQRIHLRSRREIWIRLKINNGHTTACISAKQTATNWMEIFA